MADQPTDPAQQLMNLMKAGQEAWLEAARASTAGLNTDQQKDPLADFGSMTRRFVEMQQSYLGQVNAAWLSWQQWLVLHSSAQRIAPPAPAGASIGDAALGFGPGLYVYG